MEKMVGKKQNETDKNYSNQHTHKRRVKNKSNDGDCER